MTEANTCEETLVLTSFGWKDTETGIEYATDEEALEAQSESEDTKSEDLG